MRIVCVSDLHGYLPEMPDGDLCILAGDYCPMRDYRDQPGWLKNTFKPWLKELAKRMPVVGVAGNHDFAFQLVPEHVPDLPWAYLQDSGAELGGLKIWGSPWQPRFFNWAFNADEPELREIWAKIPDDTDILVLHGPPYGYGDFSPHGKVHTGSPSLTERILEVKPRLVVAGHIHSGYGLYFIGSTQFASVAHVDEQYQPTNLPVVIELVHAPS